MGASLIIGAGNWATKPSETLGYKPTDKGFTPKEGDHERASIGSYTDRNGVLQTGRTTNYGGNILLNPTFAPETLGAQLFENSDFQAATSWALGAGWSIAGGQASGSGSTGTISQALTVEAGKAYKITIDIASMTGVGLYLFVDGLTKLSLSDTNTGVHSTYYIAEENKTINIAAQCVGGADTAVLNSLGVQETNSTWNATDGSIEFDDFELKFVSTPGFRNISQYLETLPVTNVRVKFNITSYTEGGVQILCGGYSSEFFNTEGEHEVTFTTDGIDSLFIIQTEETTTLTINIVELQEITETDENVDELRVDFSEDPNGVMLLEDAATNLVRYSEPTSNEGAAINITYEFFDWGNNFNNCVKFGDNSQDRYRYLGLASINIYNAISFFVIMDDLSEPFPDSDGFSGDFSPLIAGGFVESIYKKNLGSGVWRVEAIKQAGSSSSSANGIIKYKAQSDKGFRVVGWQLEAGDKATSYIPTNGSTRLREADKSTNFGTVQDFNQDELVIAAKIKAYSDDGTERYISIDDGTMNAYIYVGFYSESRITAAINYFGSNTQLFTIPNEIDITQFNEVVVCMNKTSIEMFINGIAKPIVVLDTPVNAELKTLYFDKSGKEFYGKAEFVSTYGSRLEAKTDFPYL